MRKLEAGQLVLFEQLERNDMFYMEYGGNMLKFRVNAALKANGVLAHNVQWMISSSIHLRDGIRKPYYIGRMSKLRSWFMF